MPYTYLASLSRLAEHILKAVKQDKEIKKINVWYGTWNFRTLLDKENVARLERRTAKELQSYNIYVAELSEIRLVDVRSLKEAGDDYTFF